MKGKIIFCCFMTLAAIYAAYIVSGFIKTDSGINSSSNSSQIYEENDVHSAELPLNGVRLEKSRVRDYKPVTLSQQLKNEISNNTSKLNTFEVIKYCKDKTRKLLTFSAKCEPFDDRKVTKMHCVGYAQVYATICNYAFHVNNINGSAKPVVGSVKYNDINLNSYSKYLPKKWADFTKDHDFVEVKTNTSTYFVDASLNIIQLQ